MMILSCLYMGYSLEVKAHARERFLTTPPLRYVNRVLHPLLGAVRCTISELCALFLCHHSRYSLFV